MNSMSTNLSSRKHIYANLLLFLTAGNPSTSFPSEEKLHIMGGRGTALPGYTAQDLLQNLGALKPEAQYDAARIAGDSTMLDKTVIDKAAHLVMGPQVSELLNGTKSGIVPVSGHLSHDSSVGGISPLSYVCVMLANALRKQQQQSIVSPQLASQPGAEKEERKPDPYIILQYFCALHTHEDDILQGPQGVARSLTSQLISSLVEHGWLDKHDALPLPHLTADENGEEEGLLSQGNLGAICRLFTNVIRIVPRGVPIYCIVDSFSVYESEKKWRGDYDTVLTAFRQAAGVAPDGGHGEAGGGIFKVVLTSPTDFHWLDERLLTGDSSR